MAAIWNFAALGCFCITQKINSSVLNNRILLDYNVKINIGKNKIVSKSIVCTNEVTTTPLSMPCLFVNLCTYTDGKCSTKQKEITLNGQKFGAGYLKRFMAHQDRQTQKKSKYPCG